jgi:hypothetical protein
MDVVGLKPHVNPGSTIKTAATATGSGHREGGELAGGAASESAELGALGIFGGFGVRDEAVADPGLGLEVVLAKVAELFA